MGTIPVSIRGIYYTTTASTRKRCGSDIWTEWKRRVLAANRLLAKVESAIRFEATLTHGIYPFSICISTEFMTKTTHFGFNVVPETEKARKVAGVFDSVAERYNLMNDLMSAGLHRLWKRFAIQASGVGRGGRVLDIAGGTGDLSALFMEQVGENGEV